MCVIILLNDDVRSYHSIVGIGFPETVQLNNIQLGIDDSLENCFVIMTGGDRTDTSKVCEK